MLKHWTSKSAPANVLYFDATQVAGPVNITTRRSYQARTRANLTKWLSSAAIATAHNAMWRWRSLSKPAITTRRVESHLPDIPRQWDETTGGTERMFGRLHASVLKVSSNDERLP